MAFIFNPFSSLPVQETFILVEPAPSIVLRGTPVVIKAKASGRIPDRLSLKVWQETGDMIHLEMMPEGNDGFSHRISSVQNSFRYQVLSSRANSPGYFVRVVDAPDIGKIKLTLIPPDYTRLLREVKTDGHIEALKGTIVNLEVQATKVLKEGKLILNQKEQIPLKIEGEQLQGNFLVFHPGSYSLSLRDELGFENLNPVQYRIHLVPDKYPQGEIISPAEDLEVMDSNVLPIIYSANDDFGVTAIRLIYQKGGIERAVTLKSFKEVRTVGPEVFEWDLAGLALAPEDRVAYRLEVWDNDSISGPKAGYSRTLTLHLRDEKDRTAREMERAQKIVEALLDLLADQLEELKDRKALSDEIVRIMEMVAKHLERMGLEKVERFDLESLNRNLATLNRRIDTLPKETATQEMERLSLLSDDLVKKTRMHGVEALAREIKNRQRGLIDTLRLPSVNPMAADIGVAGSLVLCK